MNVLKLDNLHLAYGEQVIFDALSLTVSPGDRLCLVGRNGVGKSTLLKTIEGSVETDSGSRWTHEGSPIAGLMQDLPEADGLTINEFVAQGMPQLQADLERFAALTGDDSDTCLDELARLQQRIEAVDGWNLQNRIDQVLTQLQLNKDDKLEDLSGGWRRRAALARALLCKPGVLLLDEPTNHLDIKAIEWLEGELRDFAGAVIFVTHDRQFLRNVANRIGELDRGNLSVWDGNYDDFLAFRQRQLEEEEKHNAEFDRKLAKEEIWIRQGIKARRTRNEGRVRALKKMRQEHSERRQRLKTANIEVNKDSISGKLVTELQDVSYFWSADDVIIKNFSTLINRGDKIGLIGPNGVGKSTFLKVVLGELKPTMGSVKLGTNLSVAYFDQLRDQLELDKSAMDNVAGGREYIEINGKPRHAISYLNDFLFTGERARTPIRALSGGERNRILLAKLFSKPANLLVMDEPTNDLDSETLELLEEMLMNFDGTLLLVSHDRAFLDNVVTSTIGFEGNGCLREYVGGYQDWLRQGGKWADLAGAEDDVSEPEQKLEEVVEPVKEAKAPVKKAKKLSYKLQRELDALPAEIERLENAVEKEQAVISDPAFYEQAPDKVSEQMASLASLNEELEAAYERWEALEAMKEE